MFFLKNNFVLNFHNLKNFFLVFIFTCSIYLWAIKIYEIDFRYIIIFLIVPIIYKLNFRKNDLYIIVVGIFLFLQNSLYTLQTEILHNLLLFIYLIILIKVFKEFYKYFLNSIDYQINLFLIIFIFSSFLISFYYLIFLNVLTAHCILGCFSTYRFFYFENSHLGMISNSIILYSLFSLSINQSKIKLTLLLIFFLICLLNYSLTFFAGLILNCMVLILIFWKKLNTKFLIYLTLVLVISFFSIINNKTHLIKVYSIINPIKIFSENKIYIFKKKVYSIINPIIIFSENKIYSFKKNVVENSDIFIKDPRIDNEIEVHQNLSSEVWIKSLKISINSIVKYPFGVGLNNYEFVHKNFINEIDLKYEISKRLNIKDASFNFPKLISELGIFSLFIFYFIFRFIFSKNIDLKYKIFLLPNVMTQLLFRGAGYFNGGFIIFILIMAFLVIEKDTK
jgi:predicted metalloprotease